MQRLSIGRAFRLALVGLTIVLAVIAALGLAGLYTARQSYENTLSATNALTTAAANLDTAGVVEQEVVRDSRGPGAPAARRRATGASQQPAARARIEAVGA